MLLELDIILTTLESARRRAGVTAAGSCKEAYDAGRAEGLRLAIALVEGLVETDLSADPSKDS